MLTLKQETFARAVAEGKSQRQAYQEAYDTSTMALHTVDCEASKLRRHQEVAKMITTLRAEAAEAAKISVVDHLKRLEELSRIAEESGQIGAAITAEINRGKVSGLYVEQQKITGDVAITGLTRKIVKSA